MLFKYVEEPHNKFNRDEVLLPIRMTGHSAGYDMYSNEEKILEPGQQHLFWTDVKVYLNNNEFLMLLPRSSIGIKYNLMLANTVGIIDSDYYENPDNDGNIGICLYNYGNKAVKVEKGMRIAQAIPMNYIDYTEGIGEHGIKRYGGFGSTGRD